jgi:hypothetical protein
MRPESGAAWTQSDTTFDPDPGIVVSRLCGEVGEAEVARWRAGLLECVREARTAPPERPGERFKLLMDTRHFAPNSLDIQRAYHDALSEVVAAVAGHILVAFVHHDAYEMEQMQASAKAGTGYFTAVEDARYWLAPT